MSGQHYIGEPYAGLVLMAIPRKPTVDPFSGCVYFLSMHHTKDKGDLGLLKAQLDL